jgi:Tol biopolymer transport system component
LLVLAALGLLLVPASSLQSAPPPFLLTYGISYGPRGPTESGAGLCLARFNGSRAVRLTGLRDDREPVWSPRGRFVAFTRQTTLRERGKRNGTVMDIHLADARGRILRNLSRGLGVFNDHATWSPDGQRLAFAASWKGSSIAVVGRNGGRPRHVTYGASPEWFLNGSRLAYNTYDYERPPIIYSVRLDGSDRRLLVENGSEPSFSPDGKRLAFIRRTGTDLASEVFVANADGTDAKPLTSSPEAEFNAAWSPDGRLLAITRWDRDPYSNRYWIVVVKSDTGQQVAVIRGPHSAFDPEWRPAVNLPRAKRRPCR